MMSFYGHDDGVGFATYRSRTHSPRSSSRALEPAPPPLNPSHLGNSAPVNFTPRLPTPHVPTTLEETYDLISNFINSGQTRPLSISLTDTLWSEFLDARDSAAHDSNPLLLHLRFTYDASTSTLITRCMPSPVHNAAQLFFEHRLKRLIVERRLSYAESTRFAIQSGTDVGRFKGGFAGSRKQPDVAVMACGTAGLNDYFPLVAVEVGCSEGYEGLMRDMALWLVGSEGKVRVVVVICLLETPPFKSHGFMADNNDHDDGVDEEIDNTHYDDDGDDADDNKDVNQEIDDADDDPSPSTYSSSQNTPAALNPQPPPPYLHDGHILVGQITGFLELWRLDPTTLLPVRTLHRNIFPAGTPPYADDTFELTMLDFFGWPEYVPLGCTPDEAVVFELAEYRQAVAQAVPCFAGLRLEKMGKEKKKRGEEEEPGDRDWRRKM